jgi:c-di-GMP-binding flagellar brake protein YcgR
MNISELEIGTKLEIELFNEAGDRIEQVLVSEFEMLSASNAIVIAAPIFEGSVIPLHLGRVMNVYFIQRKEEDIHLYRFSAVVRAREMSGNLHTLIVEMQGQLEKVQRRSYYRLNCSVQIQYRIVDSMNEVYNDNIPFKKSFSNNISGGGISFMLEEKVEIGRLVECELFTSQDKKVRFFGKIIRYERSELEGRFKYAAGIAYVKINDNDREAVVRYIFNEQRKLRKKGLI